MDDHVEVAPILAGWFVMGSDEGSANERPVHRVWIDEFALAVLPVTNADYARFVESTGRPAPPMWNEPKFNHPDQPVVSVTWFDARDYCEWLSNSSGRSYRLPTEAQREKAARGALEGRRYPWGDEPPDWMEVKGRGPTFEQPDRVGQDPPNGYGLHNMGDLVHEWCSDWFGDYSSESQKNPQGASSDSNRVYRGGSWDYHARRCRSAIRDYDSPGTRFSFLGFRLVFVP